MKKITLGFCLFFCISLVSEVAARYDASWFTLKNGLRAICVRKKTLPIIACYIIYDCGSRNDAIGKSGTAHYLEHMAFGIDNGAFNVFMESIGAEKNAMTSLDFISFYEIFGKEHLEKILGSEAARMKAIDGISAEAFSSEKAVILEERSMAVDNKPSNVKQEVLFSNAFNRKVISYIIGWRHEIESISMQDLEDYHKKWFAPNNAIIVLVGDIEAQAAKDLVEKYFGRIPAKKIETLVENGSRPDSFKDFTYSSPKNGSLASVEYIYHVPQLYKKNARKSVVLRLLMRALNRPQSFAKKTLEHVLNISSGVSFDCELFAFPYATVCVDITSSINMIDDCEKTWEYLKHKIISVGISQSELDEIKRTEALLGAYKKDDVSVIASVIGESMLHGWTEEEIQSSDDVVQSATLKECNDVLREVLSKEPAAVLRVTPKGYDRG